MGNVKEWIQQKRTSFSQMNDTLVEKFERNKAKYMWMFGVVYKIILDVYYLFVISVQWRSDGFSVGMSPVRWMLIWGTYILGFGLVMLVKNNILAFFLHVQWFLTIAPLLVLCGAQKENSIVYVIFVMLVLGIQVLLCGFKKKYVPITFMNGRLREIVTIILCVLTAVVWVVMFVNNEFAGIKAFETGYEDVMRAELTYPPLFRYFVKWVTAAALPWLLIIGLYEKKKFLIVYSLFFQVMFYMLLGFKSPFLMMAVVIFVFLLCKFKLPIGGMYVGLLLGTSMGAFGGMSNWGRTGIIHSFNAIVGERTLFIPALIKYWFYDFFNVNSKTFFSDGTIGKLLSQTYLYDKSLGYVVNDYTYIGGKSSEANTGYLADSYAQMGVVGMLLMGVLVIFLIRFVSNYEKYVAKEILLSLVAIFAIRLNDSAFFTAMLTGGFWLLIALLIVSTQNVESDKEIPS